MNIPILNDGSDLDHVETPSQQQLNQAYTLLLESRIQRQRTTILAAQVWLSIGETSRARAVLSQGVSE